MTREQAENMVYRLTHKDFKGNYNHERTIMVCGKDGGSKLCALTDLTDEQIRARLPTQYRDLYQPDQVASS